MNTNLPSGGSRVRSGICLLALGLLCCPVPAVLGEGELYFVTDLGPLGGADALDINDAGQVVGHTTITHHAFLYFDVDGDLIADGGELIDLGALPGDINESKAFAISGAGHIAGWSRATGSQNNAVMWPLGGGLQDLGPFRPQDSGNHYAYGVNSHGLVVGQAGDGASWPAIWANGEEDELWSPAGNTGRANDINDAGQVVGWRNYMGQSGRFAFVWQNGTATDLGQLGGAAQWAEATAISSVGYIVGWATTTGGETHAFLRLPHGANSAAGTMLDLGTLGGNYSAAYGVNDRGQVVGIARNIHDQDRPFLYSNGVMVDLNSLIDNEQWFVEVPNAINNAGQIVALGRRLGENNTGLLLTPNDLDRDGLFDVWEEEGGGIDHDGDGSIDLNLHALGARKDHKDLFVEVDTMVDRAPSAAAINLVVSAFNSAPVDNPDGVPGIKLHVIVDETDIPRVPWADMMDVDGDTIGDWPAGFDATKALRFGTTAERADSNSANILAAKRLAFRYCIFADTYDGSTYSGIAELPGNDFIVSLGGWTTPGGTPLQQAGTFMHELGHTLGLRHGGADDIGYKPNYHSVMNYTFQTPKGWSRNWSPVYSSSALPSLDESELDESAGIGGSPAIAVEVGPPPTRIVRMSGAVDYNRNGMADDVDAVADINRVRQIQPSTPGQLLHGFEDWPAILYGLTGNGDYAEGVHMTVVGLKELTLEDHEESNLAQFDCDPCDVNCDGDVNGLDVERFVEVLASPGAAPCAPCAGDVNGDAEADELDIVLFVECLVGP